MTHNFRNYFKTLFPIKPENKNRPRKKERSFSERGYRYHNYFKRTGRYTFIGKNFLRLLLVLAVFGLIIWIITTYVIDVKEMETLIFSHFPDWLIVMTLFISECFTGILPPDVYILWAKTFPHPYMVVFILALSSYIGGVVSWFIGTRIHKFKRVKEWVHVKYAEQFMTFKKYGGLLIVVAALTPLPFSPVSVVAGMVEYPFSKYWLVALTRFIRFFLYAYVFYNIL